jgi:hypothetical protein
MYTSAPYISIHTLSICIYQSMKSFDTISSATCVLMPRMGPNIHWMPAALVSLAVMRPMSRAMSGLKVAAALICWGKSVALYT